MVEDIHQAKLVISHGVAQVTFFWVHSFDKIAGFYLESLRLRKSWQVLYPVFVSDWFLKSIHERCKWVAYAPSFNAIGWSSGYAFLSSTDSLVETLKNAVCVVCILDFVAYLAQDFRQLLPQPETNMFPVGLILLQKVSLIVQLS